MSTFYWASGVTAAPAAAKALFDACAPVLAANVQITIPNSGDLIEDTDGTLQGIWTGTGGGLVTGNTGNTAFVSGTGMRVRWLTGAIYRDRTVVGTTFICPIGSGYFEGAGAVTASAIAAVGGGAAAMLSAADEPYIWSRPRPGTADGASHQVGGAQIPDAVSWLRSRRT